MKKKIYLGILCVGLLVSFAGCKKTSETKQDTQATTEASETEATTAKATTEKKTESQKVTKCTIYAPDDQAESLITADVELKEVTADTLLKEMQTLGTLSEDIKINKCSVKNSVVTVDFNQAFSKYLNGMGTSAELLTVEATAKTLCQNLGADEMKLSVEGKTLETGHNIYDENISGK